MKIISGTKSTLLASVVHLPAPLFCCYIFTITFIASKIKSNIIFHFFKPLINVYGRGVTSGINLSHWHKCFPCWDMTILLLIPPSRIGLGSHGNVKRE